MSNKLVDEVENLLVQVTMYKKGQEQMFDDLITHKNELMGWVRSAQNEAVKHVNTIFDEIATTIDKEIGILRKAKAEVAPDAE